MYRDGVELVKDAIITRVKGAINHHNLRDPHRVWFELQRLLGDLRVEEDKAAAYPTGYRCIGGPKDGEYLAVPRGRFEFHVAKMREAYPMALGEFNDSLINFETCTYTLRTHRLTGEKAFVFQGLEHWS